ncbi:hypothetical protein [Sphingobacterium sp.]|uniref:hypothetical protein n=1 Tax=Sphingobacterium sp. TaxID=341027 RepID=UPI0031DE6C38
MKRIILTVLTCLGLQSLYAQETPAAISKGKWMIETNLSPIGGVSTSGFSFMSNNGSKSLSAGGEAGYFIQNNLAVKAGLGLLSYKSKITIDGQEIELASQTSFTYKLGMKYYIISALPIQVDIGGVKSSGSKNAFIFGGQLGYAFFVKDNIAIEPAVRYDRGLNDNADGVKTFSARVGFSLHF